MKPFSQACENNKAPILGVLKRVFERATRILEIGSGTGQHAVCFAENLASLFWQTSDQIEYHYGINLWLDSVPLENIGRPIALDVLQHDQWPTSLQESGGGFDGVFSANTAHIMPWVVVTEMFACVERLLIDNGIFVLYGPFNRDGVFTSPTNEKFDAILRSQNPAMGIRDDQYILKLANQNSLQLVEEVTMPANNRIMIFSKIS